MGPIARIGVVFLAILLVAGLSLGFASTGIIQNDDANKIAIPDDLTMALDVKVAYDDDEIRWRFAWETETPGFYHDYLVWQGGEWVRYGRGAPSGDPNLLHEDRLAFLLDDGSVDGFREYGGFITAQAATGMYQTPNQASEEEVEAAIGKEEVRKYLPESREDPNDWRTLRSDEELDTLQSAGYFLDMWHWRAHRSNPIGYADDTYVLDTRSSDSTENGGMYSTNWDGDLGQPKYMFDPEITGQYAMDWDKLTALDYSQDEWYYLSNQNTVPFDPDHEWQEGDTLPRRVLGDPSGSRADIWAQGIALEGGWDLELRRALDTGHPTEDKILSHLGLYDVAFAVHRMATGGRWHYVSFPFSLGLGRTAQIEAVKFNGDPDWDAIEPTTVTLFFPGLTGWDHATDRRQHAGAEEVHERVGIRAAHTEEDLALYGVEAEFSQQIRSQWYFTTATWIFFVIATTAAIAMLTTRRNDQEVQV